MPYRNIRLHPVLRLIYFFFRATAWLGVSIFYRRRLVLGEKNFRFDGPAIVVVNHPSTLMDVFNPGLPIRQEMFFLANYGLFKHSVSNWLFSRLFCIPVKRREDVGEGEQRSNDTAFRQSFRHLEQNGVLFIAAEGTSWMNRWVREFKTGAARISLGAEAQNDWNLGVKIIPIGLTYYAPNLFRSDVVINAGEAIFPREWAEVWKKNPEKAVDELTAELQRRVMALTIDTRDEEGERFVGRLEEILRNERPLALRDLFFQGKNLIEKQLDNEELRAKTATYFENLKTAGITDEGLKKWSAPNAGWRAFGDSFLLVVVFLPFAIGCLFWFLPCFLPSFLTKKMKLYIGYDATVKMLVGLITFPLALWAAWRFLPDLFGWQNGGVLAVLLVILLGFFAERYVDIARRAWARWAAGRFFQKERGRLEEMVALRREIIDLVEKEKKTTDL